MSATPVHLVLLALLLLPAQDGDVISEDLKAGGDANKRYLFIGPQKKGAKPPKAGYKLAVVLPGGSGGADFHPFVKSIWRESLSGDYLLVQPVSIEWKPGQFENLVWPTKKNPADGMKFTTEEFVETVVREVAKKHKLDPRHIFTLSWSSGGPPAYTLSLQEKRIVTGSFVSMSVFYETNLPPIKNAKGYAYYLHHSPDDRVCKIELAREAQKQLRANGAKVEFFEYEGPHGWPKEPKDRYDQIRAGFQWLEKATAR